VVPTALEAVPIGPAVEVALVEAHPTRLVVQTVVVGIRLAAAVDNLVAEDSLDLEEAAGTLLEAVDSPAGEDNLGLEAERPIGQVEARHRVADPEEDTDHTTVVVDLFGLTQYAIVLIAVESRRQYLHPP
jgi:hypothetical protein